MEPSPWAWSAGWPEVGVALALAAAYAASQRHDPASPARRAAFALGIALLLALFLTPVETLATRYLLVAHLLQNIGLAEWVPALLVVGLAPAAAAALTARRPLRAVTRPAVGLPVWIATYVVWHLPPVYDAALRRQDWLLPLEHLSYLLAGLLLWWPVLQDAPRRLGSGGKAAYLFAAFLLSSPIGLVLALVPDPVYSFYADAPRVFGLSALRDQQLAGMLMSVAEAAVFFAVFCLYFARFLAEEERGQSHAAGRESRAD